MPDRPLDTEEQVGSMATLESPTFGALLRHHRAAAGLTQEALAERAGLSVRGISDLERGLKLTPRRDTVQMLADALELPPPQRSAFEASARGLDTRSSSVRATASPRHNLPPQPTPLIGREQEIAAVLDLLQQKNVRLLTLTGPGGIGKTRLALRIAENLCDAFANGVFFVPLASIREPALVVSTIAQTLGLREEGRQPLTEALREHLREKQTLLLLDNFEQVATAAPLLAELLAQCAHLVALVTSRAALHVRGEQEFAVPPLALPDFTLESVAPSAVEIPPRSTRSATPSTDATHLPTVDALAHYPAVALFVQRAQAVKADFLLTATNVSTVVEICARLDGLPLAIELAAARARLLPPAALLTRLVGAHGHTSLQVLTGGARDLPERQQTLRATLDWSYDLLDASEQTLFRYLSVFVGGCTLEAAEAVCAVPGDPALDLLEVLTSLVDKSLLRQEAVDPAQHEGIDEARVGMLETIREYGLERLAENGEMDTLRQAHAAYYLALAEQAEAAFTGLEQGAWLARLEQEHDNLRAVLEWTRQTAGLPSEPRGTQVQGALAQIQEQDQEQKAKAGELGLRLAAMLWRFWERRGHLSEGRGWLEVLLTAVESGRGAVADVRAKALHGAGALAFRQGDYERATALSEESLARYRELGDRWGMAAALNNLGIVAIDQGDYDRAAALLEDSLTLKRELGDTWAIAGALDNLGQVARYQHDYARAMTLLEDSLTLKRELGDAWGIVISLTNLGDVARDRADYGRAAALYVESLARYTTVGHTFIVAWCLEGLAAIACALGQLERAARLYGAAAAVRETIGSPLPPAERVTHQSLISALRADLGDGFVAAWSDGWAMPLEQAIAYASSYTLSAEPPT